MHGLVSFVVIHHSLVICEVVNGQYHQNGKNTKQNQMKNTYVFYIVFKVLKLLLIKICKIQPPYLLFLFVFIGFYISIRYHFSKNFRTSFKNIWKKNIFITTFPLLTDSLRPPSAHPFNGQNPLSVTKNFLSMLPYLNGGSQVHPTLWCNTLCISLLLLPSREFKITVSTTYNSTMCPYFPQKAQKIVTVSALIQLFSTIYESNRNSSSFVYIWK